MDDESQSPTNASESEILKKLREEQKNLTCFEIGSFKPTENMIDNNLQTSNSSIINHNPKTSFHMHDGRDDASVSFAMKK